MTKEITKSIILQEMQAKFQMREFEPAQFLFAETVVPTYNIRPHLVTMEQKFMTVGISSSGPRQFFIVPEDEQWHMALYDVVFMTGAFTVAGVYILRKKNFSSGEMIYLDLKAAQNVSYHTELKQPVTLLPGDQIIINIDGYTSTGDLRLYIDYEVETIR